MTDSDLVKSLRYRASRYNQEQGDHSPNLGYYDSICAHDDYLAADKIEQLERAALEDAFVIGKLNGGEELQSLMAENNRLRASLQIVSDWADGLFPLAEDGGVLVPALQQAKDILKESGDG